MNLCSRKPMVWLVLLLAIAFAQAKGAALAPAGCSECHTGASHSMFAVKTDGNCAVCHGGVKPAHFLIPVSQSSSRPIASRAYAKTGSALKVGNGKPKVTADPNPGGRQIFHGNWR